MTKWTVVATSVAARSAAALIAISPSGTYAALCRLVGKPLVDAYFVGYPMGMIWPARDAPRGLRDYRLQFGGTYFQEVYDTCGRPRLTCVGQLYLETRRLPRTVTKVRLESIVSGAHKPFNSTRAVPPEGPSTQVAVKDGWFAVAWADGLRTCGRGRLTAYDARGRVVGVVSDPPSRRVFFGDPPAGTTLCTER